MKIMARHHKKKMDRWDLPSGLAELHAANLEPLFEHFVNRQWATPNDAGGPRSLNITVVIMNDQDVSLTDV